MLLSFITGLGHEVTLSHRWAEAPGHRTALAVRRVQKHPEWIMAVALRLDVNA